MLVEVYGSRASACFSGVFDGPYSPRSTGHAPWSGCPRVPVGSTASCWDVLLPGLKADGLTDDSRAELAEFLGWVLPVVNGTMQGIQSLPE
jgi:hypothetical protein